MPLVIATWNTQGDPTTNRAKIEVLQGLWRRADILLLQECTHFVNPDVLDDIARARVVHRSAVAGARNQRCSTAIVSKLRGAPVASRYLQSGTGRAMTAIELDGTGIQVATMHAVSGGVGLADLAAAARDLARSCHRGFILGGDFNYRPRVGGNRRANRRQMELGSRSRNLRVNLTLPGSMTQQSGGRLDHFLSSSSISGTARRYHGRGGSDHFPVVFSARRSLF